MKFVIIYMSYAQHFEKYGTISYPYENNIFPLFLKPILGFLARSDTNIFKIVSALLSLFVNKWGVNNQYFH